MYPKTDYWDSKPDSWKLDYLSLRLQAETDTVTRLTTRLAVANEKIKELERERSA